MLNKSEIDQAIVAVDSMPTQLKISQSRIIRRHLGAINEALEMGKSLQEILLILFETTGVKINERWAYQLLKNEREKSGIPTQTTLPGSTAPAARKPGRADEPAQKPLVLTTDAAASVNASAKKTPADPDLEKLFAMLPPRAPDGQVDIDYPLPDNLPACVKMTLLRQVTKMEGFNDLWHTNLKLRLLMILPEALPEHINPVVEIGGMQCDLRREMPEAFGKVSDELGISRNDPRLAQLKRNKMLRAQWKSAQSNVMRAYDQWLKETIGLPVG